jgi:hypothetical protein
MISEISTSSAFANLSYARIISASVGNPSIPLESVAEY